MTEITARLSTALADRYTIQEELGAGGMATVYLAEDLKLHRKVAVKVLRPELAAALGSERFLREIKIAANLTHPHILPLHDSGEAEGFVYYVMPFIKGQTLRERIVKEGELPVNETVRIIREVVDALAFAHSEGVVHRDIKPDNIMLTGGHAIVVDFGVAKAVSEATGRDQLTTVGVALGTPAYMSPEQATAHPHVDHRTDIYAVGVMAYELLAGRTPFAGTTPQSILAAQVTQQADPVSKYRDHVSAELEAVVMKCLEKKPADRWQTAGEMLPHLDSLATPSGGITPSATEAISSATPNRGRRAVGLAAVVVLLAVATWGLFFRTPVDDALDPDMLAVAPFEVLGSGVEDSWGEDLAVLLRNSLDGIGAIRTEDASAAIGRWAGLSETSASEFGKSLGSGLVLTGILVPAGQDSVRITATVFDVAQNASLGNAIELRLGSRRIDNVADSIALRVMRQLDAVRDDVGAFELRSIGSANPSAIRAFLNGERHRRAGALDSALFSYERAIVADSAFALAVARQGGLFGWGGERQQDRLPYLLRAGRLNHGLAPRESLLVVADSIQGAIWEAAPWNDFLRPDLTSRLFATLETAAARYPNDPQVWYQLAEVQYHLGWRRYSEDEIISSFTRAVELDSTFMPPLLHLIDALHADDESKLVWIQSFLAGRASGGFADAARVFRQVQQLMNGEVGDTATLDSLVQASSDPGSWLTTSWYLSLTSDPDEKAVRIIKALGGRDEILLLILGQLLTYRGHLDEAIQFVDSAELSPNVRFLVHVESNRLGVVPADSLTDMVDGIPLPGPLPTPPFGPGRIHDGLASLFAEKGDTARILALDSLLSTAAEAQFEAGWPGPLQRVEALGKGFGLVRGEETLTSVDSSGIVDLLRSTTEAALDSMIQPYLRLSRGDTAGALAGFQSRPYPPCSFCYSGRMLHARLLVQLGRDREAARLLDQVLEPQLFTPLGSPTIHPPTAALVLWRFERGRVNERLGNTEKAIAAYSYVVDAWANADSILQANYVTPAREALARLVGEGR